MTKSIPKFRGTVPLNYLLATWTSLLVAVVVAVDVAVTTLILPDTEVVPTQETLKGHSRKCLFFLQNCRNCFHTGNLKGTLENMFIFYKISEIVSTQETLKGHSRKCLLLQNNRNYLRFFH